MTSVQLLTDCDRYKDHTNSMVAGNAREDMLRLKAELRKPNFSLASLSQSSAGLGVPRSVARATYTQPPVSAYLEGADPNVREERKNELESAHFVFGVGREEDLRNLRSSSVANTSYGPIPAHAYAQRGLDPHLQADLRRNDDAKPARMPEDVRKDLRASHFQLGPKTANPENWLTTQAQSMVPHPPQSNELDKALKADLRASHFSIGALGDAEKLNLDVATCSAAEST
ncbi:hypothetical protein Pmar_PMAR015240 [Perkinsus marinus ATCC 50983]|uniref:Uncharacterized protein n=1 Tax=Perkinsus marinus (strain ATCC 50983 / TXsc) TaxID=423536 RepID=C5KL43_PERM5|nr:hypothetical protein Pmar_PMAR015240 [Perkinsus marinus ATCC 50983]EER14716.1 hypothetical protein Pmar_PMAR015240 [Perkinsus marinus ATCC 50983]|eukprot:XP_002782920.1 hypothetical protein Pmar_PMAR015240 [Perkinsus marinus ATCC 50983]